MLIHLRELTKLVHAAAAIVALWGAAHFSRAGVIYTYVTDASSYEAPPASPFGTIVPVNIYLQETLTDGSSSFIAANNGLSSAGAAVNELSVSGGNVSQIPVSTASAFTFGMKGTQQIYTDQPTNANNLEFYETVGGAETKRR